MRTISTVKRLFANEKTRYVLVGGANTLMGYTLFTVVQFTLGKYIGLLGSLYIAHFLASLIAFVNYKKFVFGAFGSAVKDFFRFQSVYVVPLLINTFLLPLLVNYFHWNTYLAQGILTVILAVVLYFAHKYFSFARPKKLT